MRSFIKFLVYLGITLIIVNFVRICFGFTRQFYITDFVEALQSVSNTQIELVVLENLQITSDWGVFEFLRLFLNNIIQIIEAILYLCQQIINLIVVSTQVLFHILID